MKRIKLNNTLVMFKPKKKIKEYVNENTTKRNRKYL